MRQRWVYVNGEAYEVGEQPLSDSHHIIPDIAPIRSPDGTYIEGKVQWREHLKRTDSIEMSHSDIKERQQDWQKRKVQFNERLKASAEKVRDYSGQAGEVQRTAPTGLMVEMANRLHGRPTPGRKEMLKMTLDLAKRIKRG